MEDSMKFDYEKIQLNSLMIAVRNSIYLEHIIRTQHPNEMDEVFKMLEGMINDRVKNMVPGLV